MTKEELDLLITKYNGSIIAPAGHGKTEMITDIVFASDGKQLLLTHTNAGVDALKKRLNKKNIKSNKYNILTIAAFCIRWCMAYKQTAGLPDFNGFDNVDYDRLYHAAKKIFENNWAGGILKKTYSSIIVDEYQDCTLDQHSLVVALNAFLPVYVLGDPLQGIFDWKKKGSPQVQIVDWENIEFERFEVNTEPWRWKKTNPELGNYLSRVREMLLPALRQEKVEVLIASEGDYLSVITPEQFDRNQYKLNKAYKSILYITKLEHKQLSVCQRQAWRFQYDETQELNDLFLFAKRFESDNGYNRAVAVLEFLYSCSTKVSTELKSYHDNLTKGKSNFDRIRKHKELAEPLQAICCSLDYQAILYVIRWIRNCPDSKIYRKELHREMIRSILYAMNHECSLAEAAKQIRLNPGLRKEYSDFKCLSSRTLLSKGLEFDCVLVDMTDPPRAKDYYVALTRARYEVILISDVDRLVLDC